MTTNLADMQRESLREDIAEVLDDDNGYSHAVQTWAAIARDLLEEVEASREPAAEAAVQRVREMHGPWEEPGHRVCRVCIAPAEWEETYRAPYPCPTVRALDGDA